MRVKREMGIDNHTEIFAFIDYGQSITMYYSSIATLTLTTQ